MSVRATGAALLAPLRPALTWGERMLPGVLVIGTKRGGTSSLYDWICRHPQVAPCRTRKGTHYFDVHHGRGYAWFRSGFVRPDPRWRLTGEASPYYLFHPLAPQRIAAELPEAKLIVALRDPVDRAWSHFQCEVALGCEDLPFEVALAREEERLAGEAERMLHRPGYESFELRHHSYLARGRYAEQLERVYSLFPPDQVLVLRSEALLADPHRQLSTVWDFLGLPQVQLQDLPRLKAGRYDEMPAPTRRWLQDYFAPHNERLYDLPGVHFTWER